MKRLKRILRWVICLTVGTYLAVILLLSLPYFQTQIGQLAANKLSDIIQSKVKVGRVQVSFTGRLIADDLEIWDKQGKTMLQVARAGAKISLLPLIQEGKIQINNALLFGAHAHIYQQQPDSPLNIQFLIDAFQTDTEEKKPLPHISINSILVRHTSLSFDQLWKPETPGRFNPSHLDITELGMSAEVDHLTDDSLNLDLRKLYFKEASGFQLTGASAKVERHNNDIKISDIIATLPHSKVQIPYITFNLATMQAKGDVHTTILPLDVKAFYEPLKAFDQNITANLAFEGDTTGIILQNLCVESEDNALSLELPIVEVNQLINKLPNFFVKVKHLIISPKILSYIQPLAPNLPVEIEPLVNTMGETSVQGDFQWIDYQGKADALLTTKQGQLSLTGSTYGQRIKGKISTDGFNIGNLLIALQKNSSYPSDTIPIIGNVALTVESDLVLPESLLTLPSSSNKQGTNSVLKNIAPQLPVASSDIKQWLKIMPKGKINLNVREAMVNHYNYQNVHAAILRQGEKIDIQVSANDPSISADFKGNAILTSQDNTLQGLLDIEKFRPQDLHLTKEGIQDVRTKVGIDLRGSEWEELTGDISVPHVILTDEKGTFTLSSIQLQSNTHDGTRNIILSSPYLRADVRGAFTWPDLISFAQQTIHSWIPGIVDAPKHEAKDCQAHLTCSVIDPSPLERIAGIPIHLDNGPLNLQASIKSSEGIMNVEANAPCISFGEQDILNFKFDSQSRYDVMNTQLSIGRMMKNNLVDFNFDIEARNQLLTTRFNWDDHLPHVTKGSLALRGNFLRRDGQLSIDGEVLPTSFQVSDTVWNVRPTHLTFHNGILNVENFRVVMEDDDRWLLVKGKASKSAKDTLFVDVRGIELGYIFDFMHVKPVHMGGLVTGNLYGIHLFDQPEAHGHITVPHLFLNSGHLGYCDATLAWGVQPGNLDLDAHVKDEANNSWIEGKGWLHLIKDPYEALDLHFDTQRANLYLINRYTNGIMEDLQGRATGHLDVYGTFADVNLTGEAIVNEGAVTIPSTNVRYHLVDQPIKMYTDGVELKFTGFDPQGGPGIEGHQAQLDGRINYRYFRDMTFNFKVKGDNILAYNFPDFGDMPFCGIVYGSGEVDISGAEGQTTIDLHARPAAGTQITYKVEAPTTLTQTKFITFVDHNKKVLQEENEKDQEKKEEKPSGDMFINFDLDINPEAELKLLMDASTGDYISLFGNARLRANYYNKGDLRMYGTYRVDHGTYRMSFQDVIRKDFQFRKDGTIVFGGDPYQADLGLQAIYTVPSVSLNDLSARGTFSNSNVRVNCIMNLGGKALAPRITFDFDIPNVNEDELRMVRSLISTEEERNLQVIYLLGIGRFYTYNYTDAQQQSSTAMNSLLSSTLSGQLNQMFSTLMGSNQNWNIGANLSTGETGWNDMDVEGILSGRLLNNRLLINGNFGYRDNPVAASNFIGDFDLQWILNKRGNFILKAYSETNDRYFTKSALTTQGVGLLLKKDFIRWTDLFKFKK